MAHRRSPESMQRRHERRLARKQDLEAQRFFTLAYSFHDPINGEIVHTQNTEKIVYEKVRVNLGEGFGRFLANLVYGQVLNRGRT
jgi:hypothetical protein